MLIPVLLVMLVTLWSMAAIYVVHGPWTAQEATHNLTWQELRVVRMVLESLSHKLKYMVFRQPKCSADPPNW